ncbi:2TM domain-containing protein [Costertonia aggregata]|uniref:2TM domain-containing protein n=1 Tax=Costertonia aggregata TaxID=343403 RepID=A0A7H9AKL2_9FLAO|nr:2TM domain-containing protein [Costertonia aggregata]QLG44009.1 2TM domain-containing protein [Costertonia aggregata]
MKSKRSTKYERAKLKVTRIRGFYNHLAVYIVVNIALLFLRKQVTTTILSEEALGDTGFVHWLNWNIFGTPIIWGLFLLLHAIKVFEWTPFFNSNWEERQIQKHMKNNQL